VSSKVNLGVTAQSANQKQWVGETPGRIWTCHLPQQHSNIITAVQLLKSTQRMQRLQQQQHHRLYISNDNAPGLSTALHNGFLNERTTQKPFVKAQRLARLQLSTEEQLQ